MNAQEIISKLNLVPLPEEGGFYKEMYRDDRTVHGTYEELSKRLPEHSKIIREYTH